MPEPLGPSLWFPSCYSLWPLCFVLHFSLPGQILALLHLEKMLKGIKIQHLKGVMTWLLVPHPAAASSTRTLSGRVQDGVALAGDGRDWQCPWCPGEQHLSKWLRSSWKAQDSHAGLLSLPSSTRKRLLKPGTRCRAVGKGAGQQTVSKEG